MTLPDDEVSESSTVPPIAPAVQFVIGIGGAIAVSAALVVAAIVGIPIRGFAWVVVFLVVWAVTFLAIRGHLYSLIAGFMFGGFVIYFLLTARGYRIF
jgi:hypothetical protein